MYRKFLLLFIFIVSLFLYYPVSEHINNIKEENYELFSIEVKPYKSTQECYQSGHPRDGVECTTTEFYTKEDKLILDKQESLLGLFPFVKGLLIFIMIVTLIWFIASAYCSIDEFLENRRRKVLEKYSMNQIQQIELKNAQFIEEVKTFIRQREIEGGALSFKDVMGIRTKSNTHMDKVTRDKVEEIIKEHMKKYNPKWK